MEKEIASLREWYKSKGFYVPEGEDGDRELEAQLIHSKEMKLYGLLLFYGDTPELGSIIRNGSCPHLKNEYKIFKQRKNDNSEA